MQLEAGITATAHFKELGRVQEKSGKSDDTRKKQLEKHVKTNEGHRQHVCSMTDIKGAPRRGRGPQN